LQESYSVLLGLRGFKFTVSTPVGSFLLERSSYSNMLLHLNSTLLKDFLSDDRPLSRKEDKFSRFLSLSKLKKYLKYTNLVLIQQLYYDMISEKKEIYKKNPSCAISLSVLQRTSLVFY